jgi:hypothetical protein
MHGHADPQPLVGDRSNVLDGQRRSRALHGIGADGQRHVDAVVDDQEGAAIEREGAQPAADEGQVGGPEVLLAHLNGRQTRRQAVAHDRGEIAAARLGAVSDEAEPQLVQSGTPSSGEDAVA